VGQQPEKPKNSLEEEDHHLQYGTTMRLRLEVLTALDKLEAHWVVTAAVVPCPASTSLDRWVVEPPLVDQAVVEGPIEGVEALDSSTPP
jgi:hypothetical protein